MAVLNEKGFIDDGTNNLNISGDLSVSGNVTIGGSLTVTGAITVSSLSTAFVQKSSNYTLTSTDHTVECTANSFTITLPTAVGIIGRLYNIKNSGAGTITLNTTSSQTIDGYASGLLTLVQYDSITVQSNNSNWIII